MTAVLLQLGRVTVDVDRQRLMIDEVPIPIRSFEVRVIAYLIERAGGVVTTDEIAEALDIATSTATYYMSNVRRVLAHGGVTVRRIRGRGYALEVAA